LLSSLLLKGNSFGRVSILIQIFMISRSLLLPISVTKPLMQLQPMLQPLLNHTDCSCSPTLESSFSNNSWKHTDLDGNSVSGQSKLTHTFRQSNGLDLITSIQTQTVEFIQASISGSKDQEQSTSEFSQPES
jgi:hypothetical protein